MRISQSIIRARVAQIADERDWRIVETGERLADVMEREQPTSSIVALDRQEQARAFKCSGCGATKRGSGHRPWCVPGDRHSALVHLPSGWERKDDGTLLCAACLLELIENAQAALLAAAKSGLVAL